MAKYRIVWEERYSKEVEAKSKEEARLKWEGLDKTEMDRAYKETVSFEVIKEGE